MNDELSWERRPEWKQIGGGIVDCIKQHGPINFGAVPSAVKRIRGQLTSAGLSIVPASQLERDRQVRDLLLAALLYYRDECSGAEPSISLFHKMLDEAVEAASGLAHPHPATQTERPNESNGSSHG